MLIGGQQLLHPGGIQDSWQEKSHESKVIEKRIFRSSRFNYPRPNKSQHLLTRPSRFRSTVVPDAFDLRPPLYRQCSPGKLQWIPTPSELWNWELQNENSFQLSIQSLSYSFIYYTYSIYKLWFDSGLLQNSDLNRWGKKRLGVGCHRQISNFGTLPSNFLARLSIYSRIFNTVSALFKAKKQR